jgi:hypothetical protein
MDSGEEGKDREGTGKEGEGEAGEENRKGRREIRVRPTGTLAPSGAYERTCTKHDNILVVLDLLRYNRI